MTALWTPPSNYTFKEALTSTNLNALLIGNSEHLGTPPMCQVTNIATIPLSHATWTDCTFDSENVDTDAFHDNVTHNERFTIPAGMSGWYDVDAYLVFLANATGVRHVALAVNGTQGQELSGQPASSAVNQVMGGRFMLQLNAGDYVTMRCYQNQGSTMTIPSYAGGVSPAGAIFTIRKVSA